ncbi:DUF2815 family protein [Proteinivorax hydrogeniformans]|uniref:DUF2815 family protein n=2 Tax=Proteinivorax TaxID=1491776 RepID=A0AAU7VKB3_9FIRM
MSTKVITGKGLASYVSVVNPKSVNGSEPKYSLSFIFPKSDKTTLDKINKAIETAKKEGVSKLGGKIPANLKTPIRDGDVDRPEDEAYADSYFINANSKVKPGVVDKDLQPILDATEFYSGCYCRVSVVFYAYNANGNKGIACGLQNIQKLEDGEPLGGKPKAEDDFTAVEDDFLS